MGTVSISQNSLQKKYANVSHGKFMNQNPGQPAQFPMSSDDALRFYGKHLSQYERDEMSTFDVVYYLNLNSKHKGNGQFVKGELTCQDENPKSEDNSGIYNHGFDND